MKHPVRVAHPPAKPLLIYDGECGFCLRWVKRWQRITGERVDYLPFSDASLATRFPEITRAELETAVHLIEPDGTVFHGAAAALRARGKSARCRFAYWCYRKIPGFAAVAELVYRWLARNRGHISRLTGNQRPPG